MFQMFPDAEQAFTQVLKLDKNCEDAVQELLRVRTHQIMVSHRWARHLTLRCVQVLQITYR